MSTDGCSVRILDKDYRFSCPPEKAASLIESARYLDARMKEIRDTGRTIGVDRIAVMAALNIAHELLNIQASSTGTQEDVVGRLREMTTRIESTLQDSRQLELS